MTDERALYRAVCDSPDDDLPRLAYADLAEENGDPARADFIRTQIELARVPEHDPLWVKCRQFRPDALHGWGMAHALPPLPPGFDWSSFRFRRGFPWQATVASYDTSNGPSPSEAAPIQSLCFGRSHCRLHDDSHLVAGMRRVVFNTWFVETVHLAHLAAAPAARNLTEIDFEYGRLCPNGLRVLAESPLFRRLEALSITAASLPPPLLVDALAAAEPGGNLRRLCLRECGLKPADAAHLFALPVAQGLDVLDLESNPLGVAGVRALTSSGALKGLSSLNIARTFPGVPGVLALARADTSASLRSLDLSRNRLGPVAVERLASSPGLRALRVLSLSDNPIGDEGARSLARSPHLAQLISLDAADAGIGLAGATALARSPFADNLLRLNLKGNALGVTVRRLLRDRFGPRASFDRPAEG